MSQISLSLETYSLYLGSTSTSPTKMNTVVTSQEPHRLRCNAMSRTEQGTRRLVESCPCFSIIIRPLVVLTRFTAPSQSKLSSSYGINTTPTHGMASGSRNGSFATNSSRSSRINQAYVASKVTMDNASGSSRTPSAVSSTTPSLSTPVRTGTDLRYNDQILIFSNCR